MMGLEPVVQGYALTVHRDAEQGELVCPQIAEVHALRRHTCVLDEPHPVIEDARETDRKNPAEQSRCVAPQGPAPARGHPVPRARAESDCSSIIPRRVSSSVDSWMKRSCSGRAPGGVIGLLK